MLLISYRTDAIDGFWLEKLKITSARAHKLEFPLEIKLTWYGYRLSFFEMLLTRKTIFLSFSILFLFFLTNDYCLVKYGRALPFILFGYKCRPFIHEFYFNGFLFLSGLFCLFYSIDCLGCFGDYEEITLILCNDQWVEYVKGYFLPLNDKNAKEYKLP